MPIPLVLKFLLDPSVDIHNHFPYLQVYLQSAPINLILDILTTPLTCLILFFQGVPVRSTLSTIPHLLARRQENYADNLHRHDRTARLRLAFSVCWTGVLIYSNLKICWIPRSWNIPSVFEYPTDAVLFCINVLSIIALLAPYVRLNFKTYSRREEHWEGLKEFNAILDRHHVSTARICQMYHWTGNVAIWTHCAILMHPHTIVLWHIWRWDSSWSQASYYFIFWIKGPIILLAAFIISALFFVLLIRVLGYLQPTRGYESRLNLVDTILSGILASFLYAWLEKWWVWGRFSIVVWGISDALLWAALEGLTAWFAMMNEDNFGNYLRQRAWEKERAESEDAKREDENAHERA